MKKVFLTQVPSAIEKAFLEQLQSVDGLDVVRTADFKSGASLDLVITGGERGADDFSGCPVLPLSFARPKRLGGLLRQIGQMLAQPTLYMEDMPIGPYVFKPQEKSLTKPDGEEIPLTDREVDILAYLARRQGVPVGRDILLKNVWQYQEGVDTHTLETHIYRLRQKMEISAEEPRLLVTVEGGYCLRSGT